MFPFRSSLLATFLALSAPLALAEMDVSKLPPASTRTGITYAADIRPIFEASCFRCHGANRDSGDLRLDTLEAITKGGEHGNVIVPGNSTKSSLVIAVARLDEHNAMPPIRKNRVGGPPAKSPPAEPLTAEQVGLIRAWIDQGAH